MIVVGAVMVQREGPLVLARCPHRTWYVVACSWCRWSRRFRHRIDAEDAFDAHTH